MYDRDKLSEEIYKYCDKYELKKELFYIASISKGKKLEYDWSKNKKEIPPDEAKYIVRYFSKIQLIVIWNRFEKIKSSKKLTLPESCKDAVYDSYLSGTEYKSWHTSDVIISTFENLEQNIKKCNNTNYQYKRI